MWLSNSIANPLLRVDARENYWGTASADSIAAWIYDRNDDPDVNGYVDFQPFSPVPLPSESTKSMGGVKALFRGRR